MNWFNHHPVLLALVGAGIAVGYGLWLTAWLLRQPEGNERMREIAGAVREGATAYLRRQYTTVAGVGIVIFILVSVFLSLTAGIGFLIGAVLSGAAGIV